MSSSFILVTEMKVLGEIVFVGLGLHDEFGISLRGLEEVKNADAVFVELYTSLLPKFSKERFEEISGKKLNFVSRRELEEENGRVILEAVRKGKVVLLVPGDPLVATTHVALRLEAEKRGIKNASSSWSIHNLCSCRLVGLAQLQVWKKRYNTVSGRNQAGNALQCYWSE
jgi:diphthine synthase